MSARKLAAKHRCSEGMAEAAINQHDGDLDKAGLFLEKLHNHFRPLAPVASPGITESDTEPDLGTIDCEVSIKSPGEEHHEVSSEIDDAEPSEPEQDFNLPRISGTKDLIPGGEDGSEPFSVRDLVAALQRGITADKTQAYISYYEPRLVKQQINNEIEGYPSIFYAAATNNEHIVRIWCSSGADVNITHTNSGLPLLAFVVLSAETLQVSTTLIVATLLSIGSSASVIPSSFYTPFDQDIPDTGPEMSPDELASEKFAWCTPKVCSKLARTLNLTQRYYLEKSTKTKRPSIRHRQVALRRNAEALLGIHYFLIGQTTAANSLMKKLLSAMMLPGRRPLVLVFAGPSGHGKTELARKLGHLLSLGLEVVDCTIHNHKSGLFGPRAPFVGSERGSPLNNFLAQKSGQRSIVFLDEFEHTTSDVHKALLIPFDSGEYLDRRHLTKVDCSKTIWIIATNALDGIITNFCDKHNKAIFQDDDGDEHARLMKILANNIRSGFKDEFKPPLTGRVSAFFPFLHFSHGEQAVIVHKCVQELIEDIKKPVSLSAGTGEQLLGNVNLRVRRDWSVCHTIAQDGYDRDLGARGLRNAVDHSVREVVVDSYLDVDEEINEGQKPMDGILDIRNGELDVRFLSSNPVVLVEDTPEDSGEDGESYD